LGFSFCRQWKTELVSTNALRLYDEPGGALQILHCYPEILRRFRGRNHLGGNTIVDNFMALLVGRRSAGRQKTGYRNAKQDFEHVTSSGLTSILWRVSRCHSIAR